MNGGQSVTLGKYGDPVPPGGVDWGPYGDIVQSPYPFTVPGGHVLGLTLASIDSKLSLVGAYDPPTYELSWNVPSFDLWPMGSGFFAEPRGAGPQRVTIAPKKDAGGGDKVFQAGVGASTYLVIPGVCAIPDIEHCRRWPLPTPLLLPAGFTLTFNLSNNHGAQTLNLCVQGVLAEIPDGCPIEEVFLRSADSSSSAQLRELKELLMADSKAQADAILARLSALKVSMEAKLGQLSGQQGLTAADDARVHQKFTEVEAVLVEGPAATPDPPG